MFGLKKGFNKAFKDYFYYHPFDKEGRDKVLRACYKEVNGEPGALTRLLNEVQEQHVKKCRSASVERDEAVYLVSASGSNMELKSMVDAIEAAKEGKIVVGFRGKFELWGIYHGFIKPEDSRLGQNAAQSFDI